MFLGDIVGYYTEPEAATTRLRELEPAVALLGNHDALLLSLADHRDTASSRNGSLVTEVVRRHLQELSRENIAFLRSLKDHVVEPRWEATHGALRSQWEYLSSLGHAQANLPFLQRDLLFVGHTHIPVAYACTEKGGERMWRIIPFRGERASYRLPPNARVFFNPGSVGQPRDGLPLASYAVFDDERRTIEHFRVPFDIPRVQRLVHERGYPAALAERLSSGR